MSGAMQRKQVPQLLSIHHNLYHAGELNHQALTEITRWSGSRPWNKQVESPPPHLESTTCPAMRCDAMRCEKRILSLSKSILEAKASLWFIRETITTVLRAVADPPYPPILHDRSLWKWRKYDFLLFRSLAVSIIIYNINSPPSPIIMKRCTRIMKPLLWQGRKGERLDWVYYIIRFWAASPKNKFRGNDPSPS